MTRDLRRDPSPPARWEWPENAACAGMDPTIFFPKRGGHHDVYAPARAICRACPVRFPCLEETMRSELVGNRHGMAGGLTPAERDNVHRLFRRKAVA